MTQNHQDYFLARAAEERKKAASCKSAQVAEIHLEMPEKYEEHVTLMSMEQRQLQSA